MAEMLIVLSALLGIAALFPYIKLTVRGVVRPQLVTWGIWTVLGGILTVSAFQQQQIASGVLSSTAFIGCGLVVLFGWRQGNIRLTRLDIVCLIGAVLGIASLVWLKDPALAIYVAVAVDAIAFIPTFRHAWQKPHEESLLAFALSAVAGCLALTVALVQFTQISGIAYPTYSFLFNSATTVILIVSRQIVIARQPGSLAYARLVAEKEY